ncbi:MAG: alpha/beta fold hydrolase [Saprospiraceae bacterium]|nr:alpha/beta fold hydrolase [Saprospiraceae bacterium]MCB9321634.1 alpha/beta fold hydrolase [Lewinellaceae bacterium]
MKEPEYPGTVPLYYKRYGEEHHKTIVILHGLFGSLDNWHTFARRLSSTYQVIAVDLRNHGRSPHTGTFNMTAMRDDLLRLWDELSLEQAVLMGHSLGGKVAMAFATAYEDRLSALVVLDISPRSYPRGHDVYFDAMLSMPLNLESRQEADQWLSKTVKSMPIRQFLMKNLERTETGYSWKFNLNVLYDQYDAVIGPVEILQPLSVPALFVRGAKSTYISDDDLALIRETFLNVDIVTIGNAGHWVHAEAPDALLAALTAFLYVHI